MPIVVFESRDAYLEASAGSLAGARGSDPFRDSPDCHLQLQASDSTTVAAHCSLWWTDTPSLPGERVGCIGHFDSSSTEASTEIMDTACRLLQEKRKTLAVGPLDGSTWRRYRFVSHSSSDDPVFLEPTNPARWLTEWLQVGFSLLAGYRSSVFDIHSAEDLRKDRIGRRLQSERIRLRPLSLDAFENNLEQIHRVSSIAFSSNYLYTPISLEWFKALYLPLKPLVDPRFCLLAERDGEPVGFVFAFSDQNQIERTGDSDTLIVKSLAVLPGRSFAGLGAYLLESVRKTGSEIGLRRIVHALMHDQNGSVNLARGTGRVFRRYALLSKRL